MSAQVASPHASPAPVGQENSPTPGVSVVIPCLNERGTITEAVLAAREAFARWPGGAEVIVADNGSTDGSAELAYAAGARVVRAAERGYRAALQAGFATAQTAYVVYADADLTYDFQSLAGCDSPQLAS